MKIDLELQSALLEPTTLEVFKRILKSRLLSYYQLEKTQIEAGELTEALNKLQELGLINKTSASFHDLDKYYPTQEGLAAEKMVK